MTWWASVRRWMSGAPAATFDSAPQPIEAIFRELYGSVSGSPVGRDEALSVAALLRGRNLICSVSTLPLTLAAPDKQPARSSFLEQIDPNVPNVVTIAQTLEDLLLEGIAWWRITARDFAGYPMAARRLDPATVSMVSPTGARSTLPSGNDPRGARVWIDGRPVEAREVIRFDSPNPAVLRSGARAVRVALLLDRAAGTYAEDPRPLDYFTPADDADNMPTSEVEPFLAKFRAARKRRGTAWIPREVRYEQVSAPSPRELQLVELQQQASLHLANHIGIDPEEVGVSVTSRVYFNAVDRRQTRINETFAPYMRAITDRLSMGDVTRRGYRVVFDLNDYMKADPATRTAYYREMTTMGAMSVDEVRAAEGLPPAAARPGVIDGSVVAGALPPAQTFDAPAVTLTMDAPTQAFSVDAERRTITGLAMPYGTVASKGGMRFRFLPGSLKWSDVSRVKHLRDHAVPLGRALELTEDKAGLTAKLSVARGAAGDELLSLAEDGVYDGLSVGVDFSMDPEDGDVVLARDGVYDVTRADLREITSTAMPAFDDARVTKVAASRAEGDTSMSDNATAATGTASAAESVTPVTFSAEQFSTFLERLTPATGPADGPAVIDPTHPAGAAFVREALPYTFDRGGNFVPEQPHVFSQDLHEMALANDIYGDKTEAGKRVMALMRAKFATVSTDINELTPSINRPDMYVDQRDYRTPLWDAVSKGTPPNGIQPFVFPKFNSASGLVGDHTEGVEPTPGAFTSTNQTVTPSALSGKASITREVWDMGGNPAVSTLIWNQMVRGYREGLESATATFLNTLTAAADIAITAAAGDDTLAAEWDAALADLQFIRGYDFDMFALEKNLYKAFVAARDTAGRVLYPIIGPANANGQAASRFRTLDLGGVTGVPSWALPATAGSSNNSWLFDRSVVHGWATAPQRLEFPGTDASGGYAPVAMIDLGIWGYKAFANSDIGGVRQVTYDTTA